MLIEQHRPIIRGAREEIRDHIFIDDVVRANLYALERGENHTLHISSGRGYTLSQLYRLAADVLESKIEPVYLSGSLVEASSMVLDNARARHVLGWHPEVNLLAGIWRT